MAIVTCANCGAELQRHTSDIRRNKSGRFYCSRECRNEHWVGSENPNYGHSWNDEQRRAMSTKKAGTPAWNKGVTAAESESVRKYARTLIGNRYGAANAGRPNESLRLRNLTNNPMKDPQARVRASIAISKAMAGSHNPNWRGGTSYMRGPKWREIRERILERDHHACRHCGITREESRTLYKRDLHIHHIRPWGDGEQDNSGGNLLTLCNSCHGKLQRKRGADAS